MDAHSSPEHTQHSRINTDDAGNSSGYYSNVSLDNVHAHMQNVQSCLHWPHECSVLCVQ